MCCCWQLSPARRSCSSIMCPCAQVNEQEVAHLEVAGGLAAAATQDGRVHIWDPGQVRFIIHMQASMIHLFITTY